MFKKIMMLIPLILTIGCQSTTDKVSTYSQPLPERPGELPVKAFAALPLVSQLNLSPNGEFVAFLQNLNGKTVLVTQDKRGQNSHIVLSSDNEKFFIRQFVWVNDERLLVSVWYRENTPYSLSKHAETRLIAVNRDGSKMLKDLVRINPISLKRNHAPQFQHRFSLIPGDSRHVMLALDIRVLGAPDVYKLDVYEGNKQRVTLNPGYVRQWFYDRQGHARAGIGVIGDKLRVVYRLDLDDDWQTLYEFDPTDPEANSAEILGFDQDYRLLYITQNYRGKSAIFRKDLSQPNDKAALIYRDPQYDVDGELIYSADRKKVIGVRYTAESTRLVYWDDEAKALQAQIDRSLPERSNQIVSDSHNNNIILSSGPSHAPVYYWMDRAQKTLGPLVAAYPLLKKERLSEPQVVHFAARDGLEIEGYLTRARKNSNALGPAIVFPHGGPVARDANDFDYWSQFFADRGWHVLKINFRGSSGYGSEFARAGFQRWGLEMQDDIADATQWLIRNRIADPKKICIVGASYGGYAALMGLVKNPELYRCGISFAPITDLPSFIDKVTDKRWLDASLRKKFIETLVGHWWSDRERLRQTSPLNHSRDIRAPLLLAHGAEDDRVPVSQSRELASEMDSSPSKTFEYLELPKGDHHLSREQDRLRFFNAMDTFLRKYN